MSIVLRESHFKSAKCGVESKSYSAKKTNKQTTNQPTDEFVTEIAVLALVYRENTVNFVTR